MDWLSRVDANNDPVKIWLKTGSTSSTFKCSLCQTNELNCGNQGWKAIQQHMNNIKHKQILRQWKENIKFTVSSSASSSESVATSSSTCSTIAVLATNNNKQKPLSLEDQVTKSEILWSLNVAEKGFSYNSCNELNDLFSSMFPDSAIATNFSIQSNKVSYVMSHGLGPYFKRKMIDDVKRQMDLKLTLEESNNFTQVFLKCKDENIRTEFKNSKARIIDYKFFKFTSYTEASKHKEL